MSVSFFERFQIFTAKLYLLPKSLKVLLLVALILLIFFSNTNRRLRAPNIATFKRLLRSRAKEPPTLEATGDKNYAGLQRVVVVNRWEYGSHDLYSRTSNELEELIRTPSIDKSICSSDEGLKYKLIVIVTSSASSYSQRASIRDTWGKSAVTLGIPILFAIGSSLDSKLQESISDEDKGYDDLIQWKFIDSNENLTIKSLAILKWIANNCSKAYLVMKTTDDVYINIELIYKVFQYYDHRMKRTVFGFPVIDAEPNREKVASDYVPYSVYKEPHYPMYFNGKVYFFTGDSARSLLSKAMETLPALLVEEVFVTGILPPKADIVQRKLSYTLYQANCDYSDSLRYSLFVVGQHCSEDEIRNIEMQFEPEKMSGLEAFRTYITAISKLVLWYI